MGLDDRKPVLPFLPMPLRTAHDIPPFAFSSSASGTSTPCYSDGGMSLPHTPLPGTPLGLEKHWPLMITPTPSHEHPFTFDFPHHSCTPAEMSIPPEGGMRREERQGSAWSVDSFADVDELEWEDREEGILLSFLDNPLHPLSTPYPPGTLPPSSALDDITSQIIRFHSPPTPLGGGNLSLGDHKKAYGLSTSVSAPSFPSTGTTGKRPAKHRRTHSASGVPWRHSWTSTRRKLYEIARREALGARREDRFKGRVHSPSAAALSSGHHEQAVRDSAVDGVAEIPAGRVMKRPGGGMVMQRHGSETMLEFPEVVESLQGLEEEQAERLQRSAKVPGDRPLRSAGMQRKPSLLQRGQSFTADDFNTCLTLSSDCGADDTGSVDQECFVDQECVTPSAVFDTQTPTLQTAHRVDTSTPQAHESRHDLFGDMFGQHNHLLSPPSSIYGSDVQGDGMYADMVPATPEHTHGLPAIFLTKTSPTPAIHARNGSGSSDLEMVPSAGLFKLPSGLGTPLNLSPPGSPKSMPLDLDLTPRPVITPHSNRPGLIRARSSAAAHTTPSVFSQFMNNAPAAPVRPIEPTADLLMEPSARTRGLPMPMPMAKRQRLGLGQGLLTIPIPGAGGVDTTSLASPFDEKKMF